MVCKVKSGRRSAIPVDYIQASPDGGRRARRLYERERRAAERGRTTGAPTGGAAIVPPPQPTPAGPREDPPESAEDVESR